MVGTILVGLGLLILVSLIVRSIVKDIRKGKSCCGKCASCGACSRCKQMRKA